MDETLGSILASHRLNVTVIIVMSVIPEAGMLRKDCSSLKNSMGFIVNFGLARAVYRETVSKNN